MLVIVFFKNKTDKCKANYLLIITRFYFSFFLCKSFIHQSTYIKIERNEVFEVVVFYFLIFPHIWSELHSGYESTLISFRKQSWYIFSLLGSTEGIKGKVTSCLHHSKCSIHGALGITAVVGGRARRSEGRRIKMELRLPELGSDCLVPTLLGKNFSNFPWYNLLLWNEGQEWWSSIEI